MDTIYTNINMKLLIFHFNYRYPPSDHSITVTETNPNLPFYPAKFRPQPVYSIRHQLMRTNISKELFQDIFLDKNVI